MTATYREQVRTGIAQYFGAGTYDAAERAWFDGPLQAYGLSTVRAYQPKRFNELDFVRGQNTNRGMGALMVIEIPQDIEKRDAKPWLAGKKRITYTVVLHVFHRAWAAHSEDAEQDVDTLIEYVKGQIRADLTLGGNVNIQAGESRMGIRTRVFPPYRDDEITDSAFDIQFEAEVEIVG